MKRFLVFIFLCVYASQIHAECNLLASEFAQSPTMMSQTKLEELRDCVDGLIKLKSPVSEKGKNKYDDIWKVDLLKPLYKWPRPSDIQNINPPYSGE